MKTKIAASLVVLGAFFWGYWGDSLRAEFNSLTLAPKPAPVAAAPNIDAPAKAVPLPPQQPEMAKKLDSILPSQEGKELEAKRSQYLDKLSQQMAELQGNPPPPPPVAGVVPMLPQAVPPARTEVSPPSEESEEVVEEEEEEVDPDDEEDIDELDEEDDLTIDEGDDLEDPADDELLDDNGTP